MRAELLEAFQAALRAVDPEETTFLALREEEIPRPVTVLALGKAAPAMARGAARALGTIAGIVVSDHAEEIPPGMSLLLGSHPLPDKASVTAGAALLSAAAGASGALVVLVSGGGSALAEAPAGNLDVSDLARVQDLLMRGGAGIRDLNLVRRHLSRLKNGGLLCAARAPTLTLLISDVVGGPPSDIASGPTLSDSSKPAEAIRAMNRYGVAAHLPKIIECLESAQPPPLSSAPHRYRVIADGSMAAMAAVHHLTQMGHPAEIVTTALRGDAVTEGRRIIDRVRAGVVTIAAGETTVVVTGDGLGGRNQHAALGVALHIQDSTALFAALGTDGRDGPTDATGAVVDGGTADRIRRSGLDPGRLLIECDSHRALEAAGDLVRTGPTGTNVGDLWMAWRK